MMTHTTPFQQPEVNKPVAYDYTRFSTKEQSAGDSERRQKDKAKQWADAHGYQLRHLHDPGISAFHGKNRVIGQLNLFIRSVRLKELGSSPVLLIENFDRVSREVIEEAQSLFLELINGGAVIVTLHNGKKYARGMGLVDIITALVEMDVAHQHSAKLSFRVKEAVGARRRAGGIIHNRGSSPRWLLLDAKRTAFSPIAKRVALVREMFAQAARGNGADAIARVFNVRNEPTWSGAEHWRGTVIRDILQNRAFLGEFDGKHGYFGEPVISGAQWTAVNDRTSRAARGRGAGVIKELNLFTGFIRSGLDGSTMVLRSSGVKNRKTGQYVWHYYLVSNATSAGKAKHPHRIGYDVIRIYQVSFSQPPNCGMDLRGAHTQYFAEFCISPRRSLLLVQGEQQNYHDVLWLGNHTNTLFANSVLTSSCCFPTHWLAGTRSLLCHERAALCI